MNLTMGLVARDRLWSEKDQPVHSPVTKDVCVLMPRTCDSITVHDKGALQM